MAHDKPLRRWKLRLLQRISDYDTCPREALSSPHSAVVFVARHIGDTIATYPIVRSLQARGVEDIHIVLKRSTRDAMASLALEGVHLHDIGHERAQNDIRQVANNIKKRTGKPDLLIQAMTRETTASLLLIRALKARIVLGLHATSMRCYMQDVGDTARILHDRHTSPPACWARLMKDAGLPEVPGCFELPVPDTIDDVVCSVLKTTTPYVALNMDGSFSRKSLSLARSAKIANLIRQYFDMPVVVTCAPQGEEKARLLSAQCPNVILPDLPRSLAYSAAIIRHSSLLVSPDTSLVHMASAYNVPVLAFYRHGTFGWHPLAPVSETLVGGDNINDLPLARINAALSTIASRLRG